MSRTPMLASVNSCAVNGPVGIAVGCAVTSGTGVFVSVGNRVPVGVRVAVAVLRTAVGVSVDFPSKGTVGINVGWRVPCRIGVSVGLGGIVGELDGVAKIAKASLAGIETNATPTKANNVSNREKALIISSNRT